MYRNNANQEYRPTFVYSRRKRGALRRLTGAGWLAVLVAAAVVVFGAAAVVRAVAARAEGWGAGAALPTRSALAVAGAKSAPALPEAAAPGADARTPTPVSEATPAPASEATPTPTATPGGVWWAGQMTPARSGAPADGALVPPAEVQEAIRAAFETYWVRITLPLAEVLPTVHTVEVMTAQYAMTRPHAERVYQKEVNLHREKMLVTGRILTVQGDQVNLRAGPGTDYDVVGTAAADTTLYLLEEKTGSDGRLWYRAWLTGEAREVWIASWLVQVKDNALPYPEYRTRAFAFDCAPDGLACTLTVTMTDGGTGYYNLRTGEQGFSTSPQAPYPPEGIWVRTPMVYDEEQGRWLVDGISWEKLAS